MQKSEPGVFKPALIAGAIFGFLGGAPFVGALNCFCCSLVLGCGLVASLLYFRAHQVAGLPFSPAAGVKVGFVSGIVYAVFDTLVGTLSHLLFREAALGLQLENLENLPSVPPEWLDWAQAILARGLVPSILFDLLTNVAFGMIFATLGGLIGGAVFKPKPAPPAPPAGEA